MIGTRPKISNSESRAFTLVEVIVVMSVFLFVIGATLLVFISSVGQQRTTLLRQVSINETSYVLEYMSKALRMAKRDDIGDTSTGGCLGLDKKGYVYLLTNPIDGFYTGIKFLNYSDNDTAGRPACQEFYLDVITNPEMPILKVRKSYSPYDSWTDVALTSSKLKINSIKFGINGTSGCYNTADPNCPDGALFSATSPIQPKVTMLLNFQIDEEQRTIQTTVSQRNLNTQ